MASGMELDVDISGIEATEQMLEESKPEATAEWRVHADTDYAVYVEFGTSKMEAQPYLRPAARRAMRNIDSLAEDADNVNELVENIAIAIEDEAKERVPVDTGQLRNSINAERIN